MKNHLSIKAFLDAVDPNGQIDLEQALSDITLVTTLTAFRKASGLLTDETKAKMEAILANPDKDFMNNIYKIYKDSGKFDEFVKMSETVANEIRRDYLKTQINALNHSDRNKIFEKFPELRSVVETV